MPEAYLQLKYLVKMANQEVERYHLDQIHRITQLHIAAFLLGNANMIE